MPPRPASQPDDLSCAVARTGDAARVTVSGEIDLGTALRLADALRRAEEHAADVIIDLSGVGFMDCRGVHLLLASARRVRARGGRFRLDGVSPIVAQLLGVVPTAKQPDAQAGPARRGLFAFDPSTFTP